MARAIPTLGILGIVVLCLTSIVSSAQSPPVELESRPSAKKDPRECDCFTVSGPDPGYFQHYKLWDFRSVPLDQDSNVDSLGGSEDEEDDWDDWSYEEDQEGEEEPEEDDDEDVVDDGENEDHLGTAAAGQPQSDPLFFFQTAFDRDWVSQRWLRHRTPVAPVTMVNSKRNVFFTRALRQPDPDATYLVLRATRHTNFTSTAEIETRVRNIWRCSLRVRMRIFPAGLALSHPPQTTEWPSGDPRHHALDNGTILGNASGRVVDQGRPPPGACMGIFTYHSKDCESDIEILTSDPTYRVRYANQPDYDASTDKMIPGASTVADLPVDWTSWSTQRLDWHPHRSRWYVNNELQDSKSYGVPRLQSRLVINLWSDGGNWTGDMRTGDTIYTAIEYIELAYNRSSDGSDGVRIPPAQRHGGHQPFDANTTVAEVDDQEDDSSWLDDNIVTGGKKKKKKKCKKGKKGRNCRKKKHGKGGKGGKDGGCVHVCNVDELQFAEPG
ncbi:Endo-1-3(4)-beta-glucanase [Penicillium hispanicum]|uniref:Endo-1-3(4)-beta-glucanase n=1 Tax=Penicillium hispanicum TaxID=1080232 RepID=UPI0025423B92|nr:Endo-1-3(4)-beta-glucanase [Penicillium hispanicum]KAJ5587167.1 Endo-1-3(4)-beta-glucanase [Penicillium hispanicum]